MKQKEAAVKARALAWVHFPGVSTPVMWPVFLNSIRVSGIFLNNIYMSLL